MKIKSDPQVGKEFDRFKELLEGSFLDVIIDSIDNKKNKFIDNLNKLNLSKEDIFENLLYYFDNIFRTAKYKTTDNPLHKDRKFALELFAKVFSDLVHCATGIYITKTDFLMFLAGIIDAPNITSSVAKTIELFAKEDDSVLITGATGTGKEFHAKVIHYRSGRSKEKFMAINCAGIPDTLLESELFGYEKGAFTGADKKKIGMLEDVGRGTLFLDEIGDMPMPLQAKLLRVLQDKDFRMLGGRKTLYFEGSVIAATNSDLRKQISEKQFRKDLFYRLNVLPIELKSFNELSDKERKEAILNKLRHIIYEKSKQPGDYTILDHLSGEGPESQIEFDREGDYVGEVTPDNEFISDEALQYLLNYSFPGNYRELDNIIRRAYVLSERGRIEASVLPDEVRNPDKSASPQEEIKTSDVDKVLAKDILDYAQDIKTDIVRRKIKSIYSKGQDLKSALRNEGIDKESDYQNINKKIVKIIGKEEMTRIRRGK